MTDYMTNTMFFGITVSLKEASGCRQYMKSKLVKLCKTIQVKVIFWFFCLKFDDAIPANTNIFLSGGFISRLNMQVVSFEGKT